MWCFGLLLSFCSPPASLPSAVDSFCSVYQRIVIAKGDSAISAPSGVKRRLTANEITYRCQCTGWKSPLCKQ